MTTIYNCLFSFNSNGNLLSIDKKRALSFKSSEITVSNDFHLCFYLSIFIFVLLKPCLPSLKTKAENMSVSCRLLLSKDDKSGKKLNINGLGNQKWIIKIV